MTALAATRFIQSACSFTFLAFALAGCSGQSDTDDDGGSSQTTGGTTGVGGVVGTGGTGGTVTTGGTGGAAVGGTGGAAAGGAATGGAIGTGGVGGTGGAVATGGVVGTGGEVGTGGAGTGGSSAAFALTSPDLTEGGVFADKYTCAAAGFNGSLSPELVWTAGPAGTKSYAITFIDKTLADEGQINGYHWVVYDIPATVLGLPEEFKDAASIGAKQSGNYLGPCPNFVGTGNTDTYEFTIYALDTETITLTGSQTTAITKDAATKLEANNLAKAKLTGTSEASPP